MYEEPEEIVLEVPCMVVDELMDVRCQKHHPVDNECRDHRWVSADRQTEIHWRSY